jgi:hypothetical protein
MPLGLDRTAGVSGDGGAAQSTDNWLMLLSHERDKLHLGLCGNLKRRTFLCDFVPQYFPSRVPLVPYSVAHNPNGEGECRDQKKTLIILHLSEPR